MADLRQRCSSLRVKFALVLALFSGLLMLSVMLLLAQSLRQTLIRESIDKGLGIARGVAFNAEDPLLTGDDLSLFSAVANASRSPGVDYVLIVDQQGQIRAANLMEQVGTPFALPAGAQPVEADGNYRVVRLQHADGDLLDLEVPIFSVAETPIRLGAIHLGLSEALIVQEVAQMRQRLALLTLVALVIASLTAFLLSGIFVRPVKALVRGVRAIGAGDLDQHIPLQRKDELGILTDAFNEMAVSLREKEYIKSTFERYVSKPLARQILAHKDELKLGGEEKEVTILFSDIRRFTTLSEQLPPALIVEILNDYFTRMIDLIMDHEGMVDKMIGDSVMALFGAPLTLGDDPLRAVRCAVAMQEAVIAFNRDQRRKGLPPIEMGIGINTGTVIAGNIGSTARMEYTVIGDNVNVAARLQAVAQPGEVLISEATYAKIREQVSVEALEPMNLKGKVKPVAIYRVVRVLSPES